MNQLQRIVLIGAAVIVLLMLVFPPLASRTGSEGYGIAFKSYGYGIQVNTGLLHTQWIGVGIVGTALYVVLRDRKERKEAEGDARHSSAMVIACFNCGQKLRLPRLEDEIHVTCPVCGFKFEHPPQEV